MVPFYSELKKLRKDQNIDLAEIQTRTKINIKFLEAIETGNFDALPLTYMRLFLRAYVTEIGGNPEEALIQLENYLGKEEIPSLSATQESEEEPGDQTGVEGPSLFAKSPQKIRSDLIKGAVILIVFLFAIVIFKKIFSEESQAIGGNGSPLLIHGTELVSEQEIGSSYVIFSSNEEVLDSKPPYSVRVISTQHVSYTAVQDSLSSIPVRLPAGDFQIHSFQDQLEILLSHSDGVTVYVNGVEIRDIHPQAFPVRVTLEADPPLVTIKHYMPID